MEFLCGANLMWLWYRRDHTILVIDAAFQKLNCARVDFTVRRGLHCDDARCG